MTIKNPNLQSVLAFSLLQLFLGQIGMIYIASFSGGRHRNWSLLVPIISSGNGFFGLYVAFTRKKTHAIVYFVSSMMICATDIALAFITKGVACYSAKHCGKWGGAPTPLGEEGVLLLAFAYAVIPFIISLGFFRSIYRFAMKPHLNEEIDEEEVALEQAHQMHLLFEESAKTFDEETEGMEVFNKPSTSFSLDRNSTSSMEPRYDLESDEEELEEKPLMQRR